MNNKTLLYDGTFDGFLTSVFHVFEYKLDLVTIQSQFNVQNNLFATNETIITDLKKANRVWKGLSSIVSKTGSQQLYYAFLSEQDAIENQLLDVIRYAFKKRQCITLDFSHPSVLRIVQVAKMVGREKHRMEAFVRFRLTKDEIYFSSIEPDFNVLPLITKHFERRYADQRWMIYDVKRKYGLSYDLNRVDIMVLEAPKQTDFTKTEPDLFKVQELEFQTLWKDYFKCTNIASRVNMKLHVQHVPKRYWKYLSEKQPL